MTNPSDPARPEPEGTSVVWLFRLEQEVVRWDWTTGSPPWRELAPIRTPKPRAFSRHTSVLFYSHTTRTHLNLESGVERELAEELDGDPNVDWLSAQPLEVHRLLDGRRVQRHVPDLMSVTGGTVTLWDVRPPEKQSPDFHRTAGWTRAACDEIGLRYEVFGGLAPVRRTNVLWLSAYRRAPICIEAYADAIRSGIAEGAISTVGDIAQRDSGYGQLVAAMYHLMWAHRLACDLNQPITPRTAVSWIGDA